MLALLRQFCTTYLVLLTGLAVAQQPTTVGSGLRGQYYDGTNFEKLALTRTDKTIDFNWTIGSDGSHFVSPVPGVPGEFFSVRWTGYVYAPVTGVYTFNMATDDGMRVWIGGRKVLDSWVDQRVTRYTVRKTLIAGRYYSLRVEYYQVRWDSRALLAWQLPSKTNELTSTPSLDELDAIPPRYLYTSLPASAKPIPTTKPPVALAPAKSSGSIGIVPGALAPKPVPMRIKPPDNVKEAVAASVMVAPAPGVGLRATYFAGVDKGPGVLTRIEPVVQVAWQQKPPVPGVPAQGFSVRWTGYVLAPETGVYVFHTEFDDAHDVTFAGDNVLSMKSFDKEFFNKTPVPLDFAQRLTAGRWYRVSITYRQVKGNSRAVFSWTRPSASDRNPVVVPRQYLYPNLPVPQPAVAAVVPPVAAAQPRLAIPKPALPRRATTPTIVRAAPRRPAPVLRVLRDTVLPLPDFRTLSRGATVTLPNLYFTQSTASLLPTSRPVLNSLARTLRAQPTLRLEIAGHTDNVGEPVLNLRLSEQRARVVRRYLVQQGIDSARLVARGYGSTRPVADNRDPQQRVRNRRVEVVVQ
ncbi:PA14 domain-containing protein [Hymenobacter sp. YC55]|uniref:PA14 domain-containing protein n=1 Tax=Hymenobacter sp. YC55 TaxID=3034019 RepID=UPI0023F97BBA|nr:PA14 domain-containing protein [Hymenobacter sp. YC55]MDF7812380.1 PA14 domain-containing protein [Hymenobacter sp. YC55]